MVLSQDLLLNPVLISKNQPNIYAYSAIHRNFRDWVFLYHTQFYWGSPQFCQGECWGYEFTGVAIVLDGVLLGKQQVKIWSVWYFRGGNHTNWRGIGIWIISLQCLGLLLNSVGVTCWWNRDFNSRVDLNNFFTMLGVTPEFCRVDMLMKQRLQQSNLKSGPCSTRSI